MGERIGVCGPYIVVPIWFGGRFKRLMFEGSLPNVQGPPFEDESSFEVLRPE